MPEFASEYPRDPATGWILPYIAGIIDGEGCISIIMWKNYHQIRLQVGMSNKEPLELMAGEFGGTVRYCRNDKGNKPFYYYMRVGDNAYNIFIQLMDYLLVKRQQAQLCVEFQEQKTSYQGQHTIPSGELEIRQSYYEAVKELNE